MFQYLNHVNQKTEVIFESIKVTKSGNRKKGSCKELLTHWDFKYVAPSKSQCQFTHEKLFVFYVSDTGLLIRF